MKNMKLCITSTLVCSLLSACGGSSGGGAPVVSSTPPAADTVLTGKFIDSAVQGLQYSTESQSGTTDADGSFSYKNGETVTLKIGDIAIGTGSTGSVVTPLNLTSITDGSREKHLNVVRFLLTADTDNDASNGIQLPSSVGAGVTVDFDQASADFETNQAVTDFVGGVLSKTLVSKATAATHLTSTINSLSDDTVVVDLRGTTWKEETRYITSSANCVSTWVETGVFKDFTDTSFVLQENDGDWDFNTCALINQEADTIPINYGAVGEGFFSNGPTMIYKELNGITVGQDPNNANREIEKFWQYDSKAKVLFTYDKITADSVNAGLVGAVWESRLTMQ